MGDGSTIPSAAPSDNVTFTVLVDGRELSGECHVVSLVVTKMVNRITQARIVLLDGDAAREDFRLSSSALFVPGKSVEIQAGYHSQESTIFRGIIVKHAIKAGRRGPSTLVADCRHEAVKLTVGRKSAYYHNMKDSDVCQALLGSYLLSADVDATAVQHRELVQYACT
ncbi:MAG TPA: hypothetical protein VN260_05585, partial [Dissulfurispiraceae bacterium]|nr:hypothetical protein [Dissulfurispiraceae bacterium]